MPKTTSVTGPMWASVAFAVATRTAGQCGLPGFQTGRTLAKKYHQYPVLAAIVNTQPTSSLQMRSRSTDMRCALSSVRNSNGNENKGHSHARTKADVRSQVIPSV